MAKKQADNEQVLIQGPRHGDIIQIGRADFAASHYAKQGYELMIDTPAEIDPDAPKDVPADGFPTEGK
jgi:hypothetical protein